MYFVMLALFGLLITLAIAASVLDAYYRHKQRQEQSIQQTTIYEEKGLNASLMTQHSRKVTRTYSYDVVPRFMKPFLCFSMITNLRRVFTAPHEADISFLHGIRVLSMFWIILGHTYFIGMSFIQNRVMLYEDAKRFGFQIVTNAGFAVDSFFLISGLLASYVITRELEKKAGWISLIYYIFHRWWRLTPVYMFIMLVYIYIVPYGIEGPFKLLIQQEGSPMENCKSNWWTNFLYINNFFPARVKYQCMNWTWFLALDFQLHLFTPLIVFVLYKFRVIGYAVIGLLVATSVVVSMALIGSFGLPINFFQDYININNDPFFDSREAKEYDYIYQKPYTRMGPYLIGVFLGMFFVVRPMMKMSKALIGWLVWAVVSIVALLLVWGFWLHGFEAPRDQNSTAPIDPMVGQEMSLTVRIIYGGLQRLGWALVIGWVVFACYYGFGGVVRKLLAHRLWRPLSNLTYTAYLVHVLTLQLYFAAQRNPVFYSPLNMWIVWMSQLVFAYVAALFFSVLVEVPLLRLEHLLIKKAL